jgi:hypothetical protein
MTDKQRALRYLEAEQRGRALGLVGQAAATMGEWMEWLWTTPGTWEAMSSPPKAETTAFTAPTNARASYTTSYSRVTPRSEQLVLDPEELEWTPFYVETATPSDGDPGGIEEACFAVNGGELVIADIDGRIFAMHQLASDDDPALVARRLLRQRLAKRPAPLVFPKAVVA